MYTILSIIVISRILYFTVFVMAERCEEHKQEQVFLLADVLSNLIHAARTEIARTEFPMVLSPTGEPSNSYRVLEPGRRTQQDITQTPGRTNNSNHVA